MLTCIDGLPPTDRETVFEGLDRFIGADASRQGMTELWEAVRDQVATHRAFSEATWALSPPEVKRLEDIARRIEPGAPGKRFLWLFGKNPQVEEPDWDKREETLGASRRAAVTELFEKEGLAGILAFSVTIAMPIHLGIALAGIDLSLKQEEDVIGLLGRSQGPAAQLARGFTLKRSESATLDWKRRVLSQVTLSDDQRVEFLQCMPSVKATWDLVAEQPTAMQKAYWQSVQLFGLSEPDGYLRVAAEFIRHSRPFGAVDVLGTFGRREVPPPKDIVMSALDSASRATPDPDVDLQMLGHHIAQLLDQLATSDEIPDATLARYEWTFLPLLSHHNRAPKRLHERLEREPAFFVQVCSLVFREEGAADSKPSTDDIARARVGSALLESWNKIPGAGPDGKIDAHTLKTWVDGARKGLAAAGRVEIGDLQIGKLLGLCAGVDGRWPPLPVCDVIESVNSEAIVDGFILSVFNSRGVFQARAGGEQERSLAKKYLVHAQACDISHPRSAAALRRIADRYELLALREDEEASRD
jgi:hypothetical protein